LLRLHGLGARGRAREVEFEFTAVHAESDARGQKSRLELTERELHVKVRDVPHDDDAARGRWRA